MARLRLGAGALGLCALVLVFMAFVANAAQAEKGLKWKVNGADLGSLEPALRINEFENSSASLSFTTEGGTAVLILCTAAEFDEGGKLVASAGISLGRVLFAGCVTLLNEIESTKCKPHTSGKALGQLLSNKVTGLNRFRQSWRRNPRLSQGRSR